MDEYLYQPDDYLYQVDESFITDEAVIMIPLLRRDLSEFESSEAWKNLLKTLPAFQSEEMLRHLLTLKSVAETVGYIRRNDAYQHFSYVPTLETKYSGLCCSKLASFLKSIPRRLRRPKDGSG